MTPDEAFILAGVFGLAAITVAAWTPVHRCKWRDACPHHRLAREQQERERQKWRDRENNLKEHDYDGKE